MNLTTGDHQRIEARIGAVKAGILQKAGTDPDLDDALKANSRTTIRKTCGFSEGAWDGLGFPIIEKAPPTIKLVIPPHPSAEARTPEHSDKPMDQPNRRKQGAPPCLESVGHVRSRVAAPGRHPLLFSRVGKRSEMTQSPNRNDLKRLIEPRGRSMTG